MVNAQALQGQWNEIRGALKKKWGQLTDDDLRLADGNIDQLIGKIQHRTGEARESIEHFLSEATERGGKMVSQAAEKGGKMASQAMEGAQDYARYAGDQMREQYNRISDQMGRGYEYSQEMVRENPGRTIAAAFGMGVAVGVVLGMVMRPR